MPAGKPGPVIPENYAKALGGRDPVRSQSAAPARYRRLVAGLSEKDLARKEAPGKWSIRDIIAHLADGEVVYGARMRFVGAHDRPPLLGYDHDAFVERLGVERAKTRDLLDSFEAARRANLELLRRLPRSAWKRTGLHAERGEESIESMVYQLAGHDFLHEAQVRRILATLGLKGSRHR